MPIQPAVNPGKIDWSGENPGILLKEDPDGPFSAMALFFRIAYSPVGPGDALLLYEKPAAAESLPAVHNVMVSTSEPLGRFLVDSFIAKLGAFAEAPAFGALQYVPARQVRSEGDALREESEAERLVQPARRRVARINCARQGAVRARRQRAQTHRERSAPQTTPA